MIIQHPDGSYEVCALPPAVARWLRTVGEGARSLLQSMPRRGACPAEACAAQRCGPGGAPS
jgi:hypothetical protein